MEELKLQRDVVGVVICQFKWDLDTLPKEVKISCDNRTLYLKEDDYVFRTVYSDMEINEGIVYWEIIGDSRSEHELKIGVSGQRVTNQKAAFSDFEYGWAYFGVG
jgi:E3 ubiquitin-protein ligase NRDP1